MFSSLKQRLRGTFVLNAGFLKSQINIYKLLFYELTFTLTKSYMQHYKITVLSKLKRKATPF